MFIQVVLRTNAYFTYWCPLHNVITIQLPGYRSYLNLLKAKYAGTGSVISI
jgi:hypothetical protein